MRLSKNRPHFVGLSATLADAETFFANLTGTNSSYVRLIKPSEDEMVEEGSEYLLALRGDPVSQTALLSTTIQAAMLTHRILDDSVNKISKGTWGNKTFVFTDDLDVNNRLFSGLADAEGWQLRNYKLIEKPEGPLAQLRNQAISGIDSSTLLDFGQDWNVAKEIGFSLDNDDRAIVRRTSSQDAGYDHNAEIIVTTSTLEVGFNDAEVGAVIQHKAPRGVASYLQRKGRAGRQRVMRPLMLVILSEFGRDRVAYQQYETLIDPEVKLLNLPIDNSHIQKMQASLAVLDWLSLKLGNSHLWYSLNQPKSNTTELARLLPIINDLLESKYKQDELADYLRSALMLEANETSLNKILWQSPRSIFMEFLPTLRRRVLHHWAIWSNESNDTVKWAEVRPKWGSPVPEFIPDSSFSDLNAPEVEIKLIRGSEVSSEGMRFFQSLKEFAPGRISKRFSVGTAIGADWLVPVGFRPTSEMEGTFIDFNIDEAFGTQKSLIASAPPLDTKNTIDVYQPIQILTSSLFNEQQLSETSNASLRWNSVFIPSEFAEISDVPKNNNWSGVLKDVTFFTHAAMSPLELIRFNTGSDAEFKYKTGGNVKVHFRWVKGNKYAGIGTRLFVDAVRLQFNIDNKTITQWLEDSDLMFSIRSSILQDTLRDAPVFNGNHFFSDWVYECFIAAVSLEVSINDCSVEVAINAVCDLVSTTKLDKIPEILFQQDFSNDDESTESSDGYSDQKLQVALKESLESPVVLETLRCESKCLFLPVKEQPDLTDWCRNVFANTLAAATQQALCILLPNADERSLNADPVIVGELVTIWVSEEESGGSGVIAQFQENYNADPVRFFNVLHRCLQEGDYEQLDFDLKSILKKSEEHGDVAEALERVRDASGFKQRLDANKKLKRVLTSEGFFVSHSFSAILYSRILRSGSNKDTDRQLLEYLNQWEQLEKKCEFEVPMNIAAFVLTAQKNIASKPLHIFMEACQVQSVLWARGSTVRQSSLQFYNPFQVKNIRTERLLAAKACIGNISTIIYEAKTWLTGIRLKLDEIGKVNLLISRDSCRDINKIIASIQVEPVDNYGLSFYPRVTSVRRYKDETILQIELAEAVY